jgi:uncharacterized caspase-like protein
MTALFTQGHALIVGIGADLPSTVDDAIGLANVLKDASRCAYVPEQVYVRTGEQATRQAILAGLDTLAQTADAESTVFVYFSGHGYLTHSPLGAIYFLMPHGYDVSNLYATAISGGELATKLAAIKAQKLVVMLDCCHAGGVGDAKTPGIAFTKSPLPPDALSLLAQGAGMVLIASSREDELSYAGKPYSAFTLALLEALCGVGVAKQDGTVRVADLALHAREMVPRRTGDKQHPVLHFEHADNFVLAYYAGGDDQPKGLPFQADTIEIEPEPGAWTLSGTFEGPVAAGGGDAVDLRGAQGAVVKPSGQVTQYKIRIDTARGLAIGTGAQVHNYGGDKPDAQDSATVA